MSGHGDRNYFDDNEVDTLNNAMPANQNTLVGDVIDLAFQGGIPFDFEARITALAATTPVIVLPDSFIPSDRSAHIRSISLTIGPNSWNGPNIHNLFITDTSPGLVQFCNIPDQFLTGNTTIFGTQRMTYSPAMVTGGTLGYGIQVYADGLPPANASDIIIRIFGVIRKHEQH